MRSNLTVLITTKAYRSTILECISKFLNQSVTPYELVIVGPRDVLNKINKSLGKGVIKYINFINFRGEKNEARNLAFAKSNGKYVLIVDDDMVPVNGLIKKSLEFMKKYDAVVIPEKGHESKDLMSRIFNLEKQISNDDPDAQTPRLFKHKLYNEYEKPFDSKFGVLDEWGFHIGLIRKNPRIGYMTKPYFIVKDELSLKERINKNFKKGIIIKNLISEDINEGLRRINPIKRGFIIYSKNISYLKSKPLIFILLIAVKSLELLAFYIGYIVSLSIKTKKIAYEKNN